MSNLQNARPPLNESGVAELFPQQVTVGISSTNVATSDLYKEELALIDHATHKRQLEFAAGRLCAKKALADLDVHNFPLLMDAKRAPIWPNGISGSISHARCLCIAVATQAKKGQSVGIDIEEDHRLRNELWEQSLVEEEIASLNRLDAHEDPVKWATLMFAAKEAFYKAQYPLTKAWVGFKDAKIIIDAQHDQKFYVHLLIDLNEVWTKNTVFKGRYQFFDQYVCAGLLIDF